ncbi:MAG: hypothetical protein K2X80_05410 [Pseudomonadaceae bacterium]|nr:hypothetical protein [Pseudomonadaceae bacterium]
MIDANVEVGISGRYKFIIKKDGVIKSETPWFKNLITNQGMNLLSTSAAWHSWCQVGSGSTAPAFTDTALVARIAAATNSANLVGTIDTTNHYFVGTTSYTFSAGAAAGNIAEVGVGTASTGTTLFSRALVLDTNGNPTTITVLAGEDLVVVYQVRMKQPQGDFTGTTSGNAWTMRAANQNLSQSNGWAANGRAQHVGPGSNGVYLAYTGTIGPLSGVPSGTSSDAGASSVANIAYVADSWERGILITFTTALANQSNKCFTWSIGFTFWQVEFSTPIVKTNLQTLKLGFKMSWTRDAGP